jgi:hypothetical protein
MNDFETELSQKIPNYICEYCEYITHNKKDFTKHKLTQKHKNNIDETQMTQIYPKKSQICMCGQKYNSRSSLWRHKKICVVNEEENIILKNKPKDDPKDKQIDLIMMLIKENSELKNMMIEQSKETSEFKNMVIDVIKNGISNTNISNTTNTTNSHNKAFNLNFFLNETCKNAMNITEFADSIKLQLSDFENVGDVGFITGISNIIIKKLKALDITQRPLHCTDQKRETIYIKDEDKWEKEDDKKQKCHKFIKKIVNKNQRLLLKFQEVYPDYNKYSSPNSTRYDLIVIEALGGRGDNTAEKEDKIISNISKTICVEK